jgi:antirestriction protein
MSVTNVSLYVGTYKKYNEGSLFGQWLDLTDYVDAEEFYAACKELHKDEADPEYMFQDFEGFPDCLYSECGGVERLYEYIEACNEQGQDVVDAVLEDGGDFEDVENTYFLCRDEMFNEDEQIGYAYADIFGGIENIDRKTLERFFDFEAFGREFKDYNHIFKSGRDIYYRAY